MKHISVKGLLNKTLLLLLGTLPMCSLYPQSKISDNLKIMANCHSGFVLPEYSVFNYITEDYIRSVDFSLVKQARGKNMWQQLFNYPEYGISFFYSTLGNNRVLGKEVALNYFFKTAFISKNRFRLFNRIGIGVGYTNRKFDFEENNFNVAVGSHVNIHFNLRMGANYSLSQKIELNSGISFDHFSNANTAEPNLGINTLTAYAGLNYWIGKKTEKQVSEIEEHHKKNTLELFGSIGGKRAHLLSTDYFLTSSISLEATREYFRVFHLGVGADLFYDSSVKSEYEDTGKKYRSSFDFQTGIHISQTFVYNKFSITIQEGVYLLLVDQLGKNFMYNRGILKYQITGPLSIRLSMKSHLHILDYPELGIGIKL